MTGACQCRGVRYEIRAEPIALYACHCTECQRQSGSAFALSMIVPREALVVTTGTPAKWVRTADSGNKMDCLFCPTCGVRLYHLPHARANVAVLKPGTLDDASWLEPVGHIWTRSAQAWVDIPDESFNAEEQPVDLREIVAAWKTRQNAEE
jgi:hypothetical protein